MTIDEKYMRRCIQLARNGICHAAPNPMVGAVIVRDGKIIGEGYHVRCGEGHAEVNAIASVKDESLLKNATIYVSLEPCSHYGKTPPCADLIIRKGIPRVVVGCVDPFSLVAGRGIQKLRDAGIKVTVGVLEKECRELIRAFVTFNLKKRPYITLKWAQSADGFLDIRREDGNAVRLSTPLSTFGSQDAGRTESHPRGTTHGPARQPFAHGTRMVRTEPAPAGHRPTADFAASPAPVRRQYSYPRLYGKRKGRYPEPHLRDTGFRPEYSPANHAGAL